MGRPEISSRSCTLRYATMEKLVEVSRHNLESVAKMMRYNREQGLKLLRLSSDIIPLASHPKAQFDWKTLCGPSLETVAQELALGGLRVSMHPGQYTVLNSPDPQVVENSIAELVYHADFLEAIGADRAAVIVVHVGGRYGDKDKALMRFQAAFDRLPLKVSQRLTLENDDRIYAVHEVAGLAEKLGLPVLFDVFHHSVLPAPEGNLLQWLDITAAGWIKVGQRQKIHYSQQWPGEKKGCHSKNITATEFMAFYQMIKNRPLDIMLEVKDKNISAVKCRNLTRSNLSRQCLTKEWAIYKYLVLERSQDIYKKIREYLKCEKPEAIHFYQMIEEALATPLDKGNMTNAAQHVWGYVASVAGATEKKQIFRSMESLDLESLPRLKKQLLALAKRKNDQYLLHSLYFYYDHL